MAHHTDIPTRREIERLLEARTPCSVSIYLPTNPIPAEAQADRIELKNLTAEAVTQLADAEADKHDIAGIEESLYDLIDDDAFWSRQSNSLAVFVTPAGLRSFRIPNRIGTFVEVSDRFHVKPLLRAVTFPQTAYVLAAAQGSVRLLEIAPDAVATEVHVPGLPTDIAGSAGKASITDRAASGRLQGSEGQKVRMRHYAREIDHALRSVLSGLDLPLILAVTPPLDGIYRSVNSYPHLAQEGIRGNPETTSDADLADAARLILDDLYAAELAGVRALLEERAAHGRAAVEIGDVARAATFGAVDTALVDIDVVVPGFVDEETGAVMLDEEDDAVNYGVVDEIARRVLLSGGRVLAVRNEDVPGDGPVAAILRYPV